MTKQEFIRRMNKLKKNVDLHHVFGKSEYGVCWVIENNVSNKAMIAFRDTFAPFDGYYDVRTNAYFMAYDLKQKKPLAVEEATENRINAIAMFEAQALAFGLYRHF
jgi:hypothetical protein